MKSRQYVPGKKHFLFSLHRPSCVDPLERVVMRQYNDGGSTFDLIDYMQGATTPGIMDGNWAWVVPSTYQGTHTEMTARGISCGPAGFFSKYHIERKPFPWEEYFIISGIIYKNGRGIFRPFYTIKDVKRKIPKRQGDYAVDLVDNKGNIISRQFFDAQFNIDNYAGKPVTESLFTVTVPYSEKVKKVVLRKGGKIFAVRKASKEAPKIRIVFPTTKIKLKKPLEIKWKAKDLDGDKLTYSVLFSKDGGKTYAAIATGLKKTGYLLNPVNLPGTKAGYVRIMVTDGFHTAYADLKEPVSIKNKRPTAYISYPKNNMHFPVGSVVQLKGQAYDLEEGVLQDRQLTWISSKDGKLGIGHKLILGKLSPGVHFIKLIAEDKDKAIGTCVRRIYITEFPGMKVEGLFKIMKLEKLKIRTLEK